jgi:hypothetical protein
VGNLAVVSNPSLLSNCHALIARKRRTSARQSPKEARTRASTHHPAERVILFLDTHINRLAHNVVRAARLTAIVPRPPVRSCLHHDPPFPWQEQCHFHRRDSTARHDLTWLRSLCCDWSCSKRAHTDSGWEEMGYQPPLFVESSMRMTGLLQEYTARRPNVTFISDERLLHLTWFVFPTPASILPLPPALRRVRICCLAIQACTVWQVDAQVPVARTL